MRLQNSNITFITLILISISSLFFTSCKNDSIEGMIVFTEVEGDLDNPDFTSGNSWRYFSKARISAINSENSVKVLTEDFFSACAPQISYDGKSMIFTAQQKQSDVWQLFELNLSSSEVEQITTSKGNCVDPTYLPNGDILFSKQTTNKNVVGGFSLFSCNSDGSNVKQITFNPHSYFASSVLLDGRVLTISKQLFPTKKEGMLMVMRPDGTKQEPFYKGEKGNVISKANETTNGKIVFIASEENKKNIISVNYNRPLHSSVNLTSTINGEFYAVTPTQNRNLLATYRSSVSETFGLVEFDIENEKIVKEIYKNSDFNIIDVVKVEKRKVPRKLPSEVNLDVNTALLLCQDVNFTDVYLENEDDSTLKAVSMEVLGMDALLGKLDVEKDGSIYLKVLADTPFRIQTLDIEGNIINGPGSWLYLRPNERRGCVGCHEDNEQVPENRQPLSVKKDPVILQLQQNEISKKTSSK